MKDEGRSGPAPEQAIRPRIVGARIGVWRGASRRRETGQDPFGDAAQLGGFQIPTPPVRTEDI